MKIVLSCSSVLLVSAPNPNQPQRGLLPVSRTLEPRLLYYVQLCMCAMLYTAALHVTSTQPRSQTPPPPPPPHTHTHTHVHTHTHMHTLTHTHTQPTDITIVKTMKSPPTGVKLVMAAVCVMRDIKPDKINDPAGTGQYTLQLCGKFYCHDALCGYY